MSRWFSGIPSLTKLSRQSELDTMETFLPSRLFISNKHPKHLSLAKILFSNQFMPLSGDQTILTGAADCKIRVHDIAMNEPKMVCSCHANRVKRLAIAPNDANLFWSAAEDGTIMSVNLHMNFPLIITCTKNSRQFDLRLPHQCSSESSASILVNLNNHMGVGAEAKCLSINPMRPELLAVGANDPYVRLYDRRMITTSTVPVRQIKTHSIHFLICWLIFSQNQLQASDCSGKKCAFSRPEQGKGTNLKIFPGKQFNITLRVIFLA
jgi:WD40 repeat protein